MKTATKILIIINLFLSMVYVAGIDSLSNFDILAYGALLAGLWCLVKLMSQEQNKSKEERR